MAGDDPWLERWLPRIRQAADDGHVLELGCDTGGDTAVLAHAGLQVTATDISREALAACAAAVPSATVLHHDLREPMPFADARFGVVIASLCLHYFDAATTAGIVGEIHRCLRPGGLFLCRLNSTRDVHHGAGATEQASPGLLVVNGRYSVLKRFYGPAELDALFGPQWTQLSREELTNHRYDKPKVAWELALVNNGAMDPQEKP